MPDTPSLSEPPPSLEGLEILLLEDEPLLSRRLRAFLQRCGARVTSASTLGEALAFLERRTPDFALIDVHLPDGDSLSLLREDRFASTTGVVVMTAQGGIQTAVEAMRLGAGDFLRKPFDLEELPLVLNRLAGNQKSRRIADLRLERDREEGDSYFFGNAMAPLQEQLERILQADARLQGKLPPVLIEGETGTGKTTVARWIHAHGPRAPGPMVDVNCAALPESLAESELFGHERGAFTDARSSRLGLFEAASGGTLFLDEVSSLSPSLQVKLLKALEDHRVRRVGGNRDITVDARIIAASNRNLREAVAEGSFREDLFHRLDLLRVRLPSLRERGRDILQLARHLLLRIARRYGVPVPEISPRGQQRLLAHSWPGNVRELAHELERAVILESGDALVFDALAGVGSVDAAEAPNGTEDWLVAGWVPPASGFDLEAAIGKFIQLALQATEGNVSAAARRLGVARDYVRYRLKQGSRAP